MSFAKVVFLLSFLCVFSTFSMEKIEKGKSCRACNEKPFFSFTRPREVTAFFSDSAVIQMIEETAELSKVLLFIQQASGQSNEFPCRDNKNPAGKIVCKEIISRLKASRKRSDQLLSSNSKLHSDPELQCFRCKEETLYFLLTSEQLGAEETSKYVGSCGSGWTYKPWEEV